MHRQDRRYNQGQRPDAEQEAAGGGRWRILLWLLLAITLLPWLWGQFFADTAPEITYSTFRDQVAAGNVTEVTIQDDRIQGAFAEPLEQEVDGEEVELEEFVTFLPSFGDEGLLSLLQEQEVEVRTEPAADFSWTSIIITFLPLVFLLGIGYVLPVPGGPTSKTPFGISPPSRWKRSGWRRNSIISSSSVFAPWAPATSSKVVSSSPTA